MSTCSSVEYLVWKESGMSHIPDSQLLLYREYLKSSIWKQLSRTVFKRDGYRCIRCGYLGDKKQVHHIHYDGIYNMEFSLEQLETVCFDCHEKIHIGKLPMQKD